MGAICALCHSDLGALEVEGGHRGRVEAAADCERGRARAMVAGGNDFGDVLRLRAAGAGIGHVLAVERNRKAIARAVDTGGGRE